MRKVGRRSIEFSEDDSLSVVGKADKNLQYREDRWKEKEQVEMKWGEKGLQWNDNSNPRYVLLNIQHVRVT